ncbi:MAG TPA: PH domain-containing protein [Longimicrobiales bacterium]|nr:PH domain-containing protein [Longimicrobiales bacterium]
MSWRTHVLRILRVPDAPTPPWGDEEVNVFRAAPNYLRYRLLRWGLTNAAALVGLLAALKFSFIVRAFMQDAFGAVVGERGVTTAVWLFEGGAIVAFVAQAAAALLLLRLDIEQRWYLVSNRSIRIREGLVRLHEKTMTLANVQHVSVKQGPLQRLLGIADVEVRTAGGGGSSSDKPGEKKDDLHVAYFHGVADAEAIRDAVRDRLRASRDAGLGDPDDHDHATEAPTSLLESARELAGEARLLRRALAR